MKGFEPVTLSWKGESYTVPADQQLMLIAKIEDALAGSAGQPAVMVLTRQGGPTYSKLALAFGAALRHAGADVTDDEIYLSIMEDFAESNAEVAMKVQAAILALLSIIAPPVAKALMGDGGKKSKGAGKE